MGAIRLIGLGFIGFGNMGGLWLLLGDSGSIIPALRGNDLSLLVSGGFVALVVVGILMFIGEADARSR